MPIVTSYPFKNAPLDKKDEIVITEVNASGQPSRSTSMEVVADFNLKTNTFVFSQPSTSATWVILHNMGKNPSVSVVDSAKSVVIGNVKYDSLNQVTVTFSAPFSGFAFLN